MKFDARIRLLACGLLTSWFVLAIVSGCSDPDPSDGDGDVDGDVDGDGDGDCSGDGECDDGLFCNGAESCDPGGAGADGRGCVAGEPPCAAEQTCDEDGQRCSTPCDDVADADGDGHDALECGGDDCDDSDVDRFPGNVEVCDDEGHDEDCDEATVGDRDADGDGHVDAACCNGAICGGDCDDNRALVNPDASEACNNRDDDCNGDTDEEGAFCPVGMCIGNRCQAVPWEWTFPAADDDAVWGLETDSLGAVYLGLNASGSDIDSDGSDEWGGHLAAFEPDGRVRWVTSTGTLGGRLPEGRSRLAASPDGTHIATASGSALNVYSTTDGSLVRTIDIAVPSSTHSRVVGVGVLERGIVAAVEFTLATTDNGIELLVFDVAGTELARTRLLSTGGGYELRDIDVSDRWVALIGNSDGPYDLAGTSVNGLHIVELDADLTPTWAFDAPATRVAVSADGDIAFTGEFTGTLDPEWEESRTWTADGTDNFIAVFDASGSARYTRVHTGAGQVHHNDISFDGRESYFEAGGFTDILSMPPRGTFGPASSTDAFYAHVDGTDDFTLDAFALGGGDWEAVIALKADVFGALILAGTFGRDGITLPSGTTYPGVERNNVFLVRLADF